jgi:hypothetical protein
VQSALEAPTAKQVAERLLKGALAMQCGNTDPKGCMGVISSVANTAHAECIRNEILARRASSDRALIERFERAQEEGDLPAGVEPKMLQGLAVQAGSGVSEDRLTQLVDTALTMWPSS